MKKIISGFIYSLSAIAAVSISLFAVSCAQEELIGNPSSGIEYNVTCAGIDGGTLCKSTLGFEGSDIPLCLNTYEGIDVCSLQSEQIETRGTLYNNGDLLTSFKVCAFNGNKELFYDREVKWDGAMWKSDENTEWPYGKSLRFLAYANEPESNFVLSSYPNLTTFDFGLEANAADQRDVLLGYYNGPGNPTRTADIEFQHPMTAVIFKLGNIVTPNFASVKSITLTGVASKGQFNTPTSVGDQDASWTIPEDEKYSFAVNLTESSSKLGLPVSDEGTIGEAFLLIPQDLAEHHVRVEVKFNLLESKTFTLTARLDQGEWKRGCTNIYTIGYEEELSDYVFTVDKPYFSFVNTSGKSEKTLKVTSHCQNANLGSREALPFEMEYSLDGGESWAPYDVQAQEQTGITAAVSSPSSNVYTVTLTSSNKIITTMPKNRWADDSVVASDWDLSKCNVGGEGYNASNPQNTANTYIVKHPGTYRFPCVYGNSVRNGMATDAGYRSSASGESVVSVLMNAIGNEIGSAYILKDVSSLEDFHPRAALLWTDAKGTDDNVVVKDVELNYDAAAPEDAYISFSTSDKSALVHGNAYIILYNDKDNDGSYGPVELTPTTTGSSLLTKDIVLWSWQIWITDADLSAESTFEIGSTEGTTGHARLMNRFLGWNDGDVDGAAKYYAPNPGFENFKLRVIQRYSDNICTVDISQEEIYYCAKGSAPYYQYGRNIPVQGAYTRKTTIKNGYNADGTSYSQTSFTGQTITDPVFYYKDNSTNTTREQAITYMVNGLKLPQLFIKASGWDRWFTNLWSINNNAAGTDIQTVKTVYDPSPYGYKIPNFGLLFDNLKSQHSFIRVPGSSSESTDYIGIKYYNESTHSGIFFPSTGARKHDYSSIINTHSPNLMTSSIYQKADYGYNQMYIAVFGSNNTFFKSTELIYKGCAAPILPILDE